MGLFGFGKKEKGLTPLSFKMLLNNDVNLFQKSFIRSIQFVNQFYNLVFVVHLMYLPITFFQTFVRNSLISYYHRNICDATVFEHLF